MSSTVGKFPDNQNFKIITTNQPSGSGSTTYSPEKAINFAKTIGYTFDQKSGN